MQAKENQLAEERNAAELERKATAAGTGIGAEWWGKIVRTIADSVDEDYEPRDYPAKPADADAKPLPTAPRVEKIPPPPPPVVPAPALVPSVPITPAAPPAPVARTAESGTAPATRRPLAIRATAAAESKLPKAGATTVTHSPLMPLPIAPKAAPASIIPASAPALPKAAPVTTPKPELSEKLPPPKKRAPKQTRFSGRLFLACTGLSILGFVVWWLGTDSLVQEHRVEHTPPLKPAAAARSAAPAPAPAPERKALATVAPSLNWESGSDTNWAATPPAPAGQPVDLATPASQPPAPPAETVKVAKQPPPPAPPRPEPSALFQELVAKFKINGVMQGKHVRAIIDGGTFSEGDYVALEQGVRLVGADAQRRQLIFEDKSGARIAVDY